MGTIRRLTDLQLGSIGTTKILTLTTAETVFQISSGNRAFEAGNNTLFNIFYGQSNLAVNSGLIISSSNGAKFWDTITDDFSMYFRLNTAGVSVQLIIQEYKGN